MTDQELMSDIQRLVIEPADGGATWPSLLWTAPEVIGYINQRQNRFLKETACVTATGILVWPAGLAINDLPSDWIGTVRCVWRRTSIDNAYFTMYQGDDQSLDWGRPGWRSVTGVPLVWSDSEGAAPPRLKIAPTPSVDGEIHLVYVACCDPVDGSGVFLTVPDDYTVALRYGVLADMYGKQGRAFDPVRAAYAESRFVEGVTHARTYLKAGPHG